MIGSIIAPIYNGGVSGLMYAWYDSPTARYLCLLSPLHQPAADNVFYYVKIVDNNSFCLLLVTLLMAELTSTIPTPASVYHWPAALAGPRFAKP